MTQRFFWLLGLCAGLSVTPPPAAAETRCDPWFEPLKTATDPASESLFRRQALLCLAVEEHKSAKKEKILSYSLKNDATDPALSAVYKTESKTGRKPSDFSDRAGMQTCLCGTKSKRGGDTVSRGGNGTKKMELPKVYVLYDDILVDGLTSDQIGALTKAATETYDRTLTEPYTSDEAMRILTGGSNHTTTNSGLEGNWHTGDHIDFLKTDALSKAANTVNGCGCAETAFEYVPRGGNGALHDIIDQLGLTQQVMIERVFKETGLAPVVIEFGKKNQ